jgi:cell division septum initiation protein DivIVA
LQAEVSELERLIQAEQEVSDEKIKARTEETEQVERRTQLQRDTMRADIIQAEAHFEKEEM